MGLVDRNLHIRCNTKRVPTRATCRASHSTAQGLQPCKSNEWVVSCANKWNGFSSLRGLMPKLVLPKASATAGILVNKTADKIAAVESPISSLCCMCDVDMDAS
eukprot:1265013-Amphidinium_carterae.1